MIRAALILALTLAQPAAAQDTETLLTARRAAQALSTAAWPCRRPTAPATGSPP